ncbi:MAG: hypothetical protein U5S82_14230 [Gammaproteobacteria bacterium]|nr:hypothetical protein [Gammaproteobacteria bacterium]
MIAPRRLLRWAEVTTALALVAIFAAVVASALQDARFEVVNASGEVAEVTALWRDRRRELGRVAPGQRLGFTVDDEGGMAFAARFPSGRTLASEPVYFTDGTAVIVTVGDGGMDVRHDFDGAPAD